VSAKSKSYEWRTISTFSQTLESTRRIYKEDDCKIECVVSSLSVDITRGCICSYNGGTALLIGVEVFVAHYSVRGW